MGADHNLVDDKNNTVLHYASRNLEYALKSTLGAYHPRLALCHQLTHASVRLYVGVWRDWLRCVGQVAAPPHARQKALHR